MNIPDDKLQAASDPAIVLKMLEAVRWVNARLGRNQAMGLLHEAEAMLKAKGIDVSVTDTSRN